MELYFYFKPHLAASDNNLITEASALSQDHVFAGLGNVRCCDEEKQMSGPHISGPRTNSEVLFVPLWGLVFSL